MGLYSKCLYLVLPVLAANGALAQVPGGETGKNAGKNGGLSSSVTSHRLVVIDREGSLGHTRRVGETMYGGTATLTVPEVRMTRFEFESAQALEIARKLFLASPTVEEAYADKVARSLEIPNDPYWQYLWGNQFMRVNRAWDLRTSGPSIKVAVIDTGINPTHPDLQFYEPRWDYVDSDPSPWDGNGHGTHVAGTLAATVSNGIGVSGVGRGCHPYIYRVLNNSGLGYYSDMVAAIVQASNDGCHVINLSLGGTSPDSALENACNVAVSNGSVICAAAGNDNTFLPQYPAYYQACIAVGSIDPNGQRSSFSNYGSWVDVAAPGKDILSTTINGGYGYMNGTSMATPHVAGLAALAYRVYDWRSGFYAKRVRGHIQNVARPTAEGWCFFGIVDAYATITRMGSFANGPGAQHASVNRMRAQKVCVNPADGSWFGVGVEIQSDVSQRIFVTKYLNGNRQWTYSGDWTPSASANDVQIDGVGGVYLAGQQDGKFALWSISNTGTLNQLITLPNQSTSPGSAMSLQVFKGKAYTLGTQWVSPTQRRITMLVANQTTVFNQQALSAVEGEGIQILVNKIDHTMDVLARSWPVGLPRSIQHFRVRPSDLAVLNSQRFTNPAGDIDASMMVQSNHQIVVASQVSPADGGGSAGLTILSRFGLEKGRYINLRPGYFADQLNSVLVANYPDGGFIVSFPKNNIATSSNDCVVLRLNSGFNLSSSWPADAVGPVGVRNLRGFAYGDARANSLIVAPNGDVILSGAGYEDYSGVAAPVLWCLSQGGDHRGMEPLFNTDAGEFVSAVLHPSGYLLLAGWIKSGYQPAWFPMYRLP